MKYRVLFDLECTCWPDNSAAQMEIIEIGAVKFHPKSFAITETFNALVKPHLNPSLSAFCKELTGITQAEVDSGLPFRDAFANFMSWSDNAPLFMAWGAFDYKQLELDCNLHEIRCFPPRKYMNAKSLYTYFTGMRGSGLGKKLKAHGLTFEGKEHRALDDSINTLRVLREAWEGF